MSFGIIWHEPKKAEGGMGMELAACLKDRGIKARNTHSPYYGHIAIEVELTQAKVAGSIIDELKGN